MAAEPEASSGTSPARLERVDGWELVSRLGESELAEVYRARPLGCAATAPTGYVFKRLLSDRANDSRAIACLVREAQLGQSLVHPHLVSVLASRTQAPPYYLVMPFLEGSTWAERWAGGHRPDLATALWHARQVAEALDCLHQGGWTHGDVKPANVLVSSDDHVTLLDLGFARRADEEPGSALDRVVLGTPHYLAPERISSRLRSDIRSDLYSLGVSLFELLAGRRPFEAATLAELATSHCQTPAPDLRVLAPAVPCEVARLVEQLLAKDPLRRPQSPRELIDRLVDLEIAHFAARSWQEPWAEEVGESPPAVVPAAML